MNRLAIRSILALLLAVTLPLHGLAFAVQGVAAPAHFHPSALAGGVVHAHEHRDGHANGTAVPHTHALDDEDVVYVIGDDDPSRTAAVKLLPLDGVPRAAPLLVAAPREALAAAAAAVGPVGSRSVAPLRRPPRAG